MAWILISWLFSVAQQPLGPLNSLCSKIYKDKKEVVSLNLFRAGLGWFVTPFFSFESNPYFRSKSFKIHFLLWEFHIFSHSIAECWQVLLLWEISSFSYLCRGAPNSAPCADLQDHHCYSCPNLDSLPNILTPLMPTNLIHANKRKGEAGEFASTFRIQVHFESSPLQVSAITFFG